MPFGRGQPSACTAVASLAGEPIVGITSAPTSYVVGRKSMANTLWDPRSSTVFPLALYHELSIDRSQKKPQVQSLADFPPARCYIDLFKVNLLHSSADFAAPLISHAHVHVGPYYFIPFVRVAG